MILGKDTAVTASPRSYIDTYSPKFQREQNSTWYHPHLYGIDTEDEYLNLSELDDLAYEYYFRFLPFFTGQPEGSIKPNVRIFFNNRLRKKLGLTYLFDRYIKLNQNYFSQNPINLPYTIFHEMTHLWLYDCELDPNHTQRFYAKMEEFSVCMLPVDPSVFIHSRVAPEAKNVYSCPECKNRWYKYNPMDKDIFCGPCFDKTGAKYYAIFKKN